MKWQSLIFMSQALIVIAQAQTMGSKKTGISSALGLGCYNYATEWNFGCAEDQIMQNCKCNSEEFLGTVINCINRYNMSENEIINAYSYLETFCHFYSNNTLNYSDIESIYSNSSKYLVHPVDDKVSVQRVYNPVDISEADFMKQYRAAQKAKNQVKLGSVYGVAMVAYWVIIMSGAIIVQFLRKYYPESLDSMTGSFAKKIRKNLTLPALFGQNHMRPVNFLHLFNISAPTRGQSLIVFIYLCLNILLLLVNYELYTPNPYLESKSVQIVTYLGHRSGIMAFSQLPLIVLFAARNNPFEHLTGWSFSSFQVYHHWVARMMVIHALIHSTCFTVIAYRSATVEFRWQHVRNWRFGNAAMYIAIAMIMFSTKMFRRRVYEFFVAFHRFAFIFFFIGLWFHCVDFGWMVWLYVTLAFYLTEQLMRIIKQIHSGFLIQGVFSLDDDGTIKVSLAYSGRWKPKPGNFIYIRILQNKYFWQNHPFTIYESPLTEEQGRIQLRIKPKGGMTANLSRYLETFIPGQNVPLTCLVEGPYGCSQPMDQYDSSLIITGGIGVTSAYAYASSLVKKSIATQRNYHVTFIWVVQTPQTIKMFEDELMFLLLYHNIVDVRVFVTKASLKPEIMPPINSAVEDKTEKEQAVFTRVEEIDESEMYSHSLRHSQSAATMATRVEMDVSPSSSNQHYARYNEPRAIPMGSTIVEAPPLAAKLESPRSIRSPSLSATKERSNIDLCAPWIHYCKPLVSTEVSEFLKCSPGLKAITTCGPPSFVDQVRYSIVQNIVDCPSRIDYFEEAFSW